MYVKITNGTVDQYPYTVGNLRRDNPNTSFPKRPSDEMLADWGMYPVVVEDLPDFNDRTQVAVQESSPTLQNGSWTIRWIVSDKTQEEIQEYDDGIANRNRGVREGLLSQTDWWALPDSPTMTAEQTAYRQALRDITTHANWPHLGEDDWPTKP